MPEGARQRLEKGDARPDGELVIAAENLPRQRHAGRLAPVRQQLLAEIGEALAALGEVLAALACAVDQRAPALRDRLQQFAEK